MRHTIPLLALLPLLFATTPADAREPAPITNTHPLTFQIKLEKTEVRYGRPIAFEVVVTNPTKKTVPFYTTQSVFTGGELQVELVDRHGAVWVPVPPPITMVPHLRTPSTIVVLGAGLGFHDGVHQIAPGKSLRFRVGLQWFRRREQLPGQIQPVLMKAGIPVGKWTLRVRYRKDHPQVPSAKPYYPPRQLRTTPLRPRKLVPGLFQGTLSADTPFVVTAPVPPDVEKLRARIRELEAKLAKANALLEKVRGILQTK